MNLLGFINTEELIIQTPSYVQLPANIVDFMRYDRSDQYSDISETLGQKILCDADRICEAEDLVNCWLSVPSEQSIQQIGTAIPILTQTEIRLLEAHFEIISVWYNESDGNHHGKRLLKAVKQTRSDGLILDKSDAGILVV